mmetsp:Transcript_12646/g.27352  ORF Transcript_12646/g.27352 Transcript_12646/m.27352 type:complete len:234 (-) Transcript_12646:356-1057(-)
MAQVERELPWWDRVLNEPDDCHQAARAKVCTAGVEELDGGDTEHSDKTHNPQESVSLGEEPSSHARVPKGHRLAEGGQDWRRRLADVHRAVKKETNGVLDFEDTFLISIHQYEREGSSRREYFYEMAWAPQGASHLVRSSHTVAHTFVAYKQGGDGAAANVTLPASPPPRAPKRPAHSDDHKQEVQTCTEAKEAASQEQEEAAAQDAGKPTPSCAAEERPKKIARMLDSCVIC